MMLKSLRKSRFTLTELLVTIVILVTLLAVGMKGVREIRSGTLAQMGIVEMKQAVQKAYQFSLLNESPSVIKITKESTGVVRGAIQATQGFAMNGYFTLDNGVLDNGVTPGYFANNAREKTGFLIGELGALKEEEAIKGGMTGGGLNLAWDDGDTTDDRVETSFKISPKNEPIHLDMWLFNIIKEEAVPTPNDDSVGFGIIFQLGSFEGRVQDNRLYFWQKKIDSGTEPSDPDVGDSYISDPAESWTHWWTDIDPGTRQWNKLGLTMNSGKAPDVYWNGIPVEHEEEKLVKTIGTKSTWNGTTWDDTPHTAGKGYPSTNQKLAFPRLSASTGGNNLSSGWVDNLGTYDLGTGTVVMNDLRGGYYEVFDSAFQEISNVTITLNPKGEVVSPAYTFLRYVPSGGEPSPIMELEGTWDGSDDWYNVLADGLTGVTIPYTLTAGADPAMVPSSGVFAGTCTQGWQCGINYQYWSNRSPELISYTNLSIDEGAGTITFDIVQRCLDTKLQFKGGKSGQKWMHFPDQHNPGHDLKMKTSYVAVSKESRSYVEFIAAQRPKW